MVESHGLLVVPYVKLWKQKPYWHKYTTHITGPFSEFRKGTTEQVTMVRNLIMLLKISNLNKIIIQFIYIILLFNSTLFICLASHNPWGPWFFFGQYLLKSCLSLLLAWGIWDHEGKTSTGLCPGYEQTSRYKKNNDDSTTSFQVD